MTYVDFLTPLHRSTRRDYLARVNEFPKAEASRRAREFEFDYWDGDRKFGYGGMRYDGRWLQVAEKMAVHYGLKAGDRVLDVGCGKGFLIHELARAVPGLEVYGIDISRYALSSSKEEVRSRLARATAPLLPFRDGTFELVLSINTLHNLRVPGLVRALAEMERLGRQKYLVVESYRNIDEMVNLLYWQLTCECFFAPEEWEWFFGQSGYTGDHSFIYFE